MATQKKKGPQVSRPPKAEERSRSIPRAEGRAKSIVKLEGRGRSIPKEVLNEEAEPKVEEIPPTITIQINEKKAILPNGKVSGIATVKAETDKVTRGVVASCIGQALVEFKGPLEEEGSKKKVVPVVTYTSVETYVDSWQYLLGTPGIHEINLPAGSNAYEFSFTLPQNVACSYIGEHGKIEYRIEVRIKGYGEKVKDQVVAKIFKVKAPLSLNKFPDAWRPLPVVAKKIRKVLCLHLGLIGFLLEIPHGGLVTGETTPFTGELVNTTQKWKVTGVQVRILQSDLFAAGGKMSWVKRCIYEENYPGIDSGRIDYWNGFIGPIPQVPPTNLNGCRIIRVSYWLQVCLSYTKAYSKELQYLTEVSELIVGTQPFKETAVEKALEANEKTRQREVLKMGRRYKHSLDEIIGEEPSVSYFVNFSDRFPKNLMARRGLDDE